MASGGNQGRMVFDIRGRRKTAVKVVYAVLAVLMGLSLFLVTGGLNLGQIFGTNGSTTEASQQFEEQAERLETKLKKEPENSDLLLAITRARVNAGNAGATKSPTTGANEYTREAFQDFQQASQTWSEYLKTTDEPSAGVAQLMSTMLLTLAELSRGNEIKPNVEAAVEAQKIVAEQRPNLNTLSTLAFYQTLNFEYKAGEESAAKAKKFAGSKTAGEAVDTKLKETQKTAHAFEATLKQFEKESKEAGGGQPTLTNPSSGFGGAALGP